MEWPAWAGDDRATERLIEQAELDRLFEGAEPDDPPARMREEDRTYLDPREPTVTHHEGDTVYIGGGASYALLPEDESDDEPPEASER